MRVRLGLLGALALFCGVWALAPRFNARPRPAPPARARPPVRALPPQVARWEPANLPSPPAEEPEREPSPRALEEVEWTFSPPPGFHRRAVEVELASPVPRGMEVRTTEDGTEPTGESPLLSGPLRIERSTVIRAAGFKGGERATRVASASYWIEPAPALPVFSISLRPEDFQAVQLFTQARGREAERPAFLEVFDAEGKRTAATGFGLRLHGGAGRQGGFEVKKAYRAYFRKLYGKGKLRAALFEGTPVREFDALVFRSGYNDRLRPGRGDYNVRAAYVRDEAIRGLHRDMGALAARGTWALLYVNMEPRGLYNIVERPGSGFLSSYLGEGDWDVVKTGDEVQSGSQEEWASLLRAAAQSRPGDPRSYEELRSRVDLENFASYMILNFYVQNHDWAFNNWYAARKRAPGARWIFLSWDAEWGLGLRPPGWQSDTFLFLVSQRNSIRDIFAALLGHQQFRELFLKRAKEHLAGALRPENVLAHLARERERIAPFMGEELGRFAEGYSVSDWKRNVAEAEQFARERGAAFLAFLEKDLAEPFRLPAGFSQFGDGATMFFPGGIQVVPGQPLRIQRGKVRIEERK